MTLANTSELQGGVRVSCGCRSKSAGEIIIETILTENHIQYQNNSAYFTDLIMPGHACGRYDFILFDNEHNPYRLIEYDGEQHFKDVPIFKGTLKERQEYDNIKNKYALDHNIPLVRIPYWEQKNITLDMLLGDEFLIRKD